MTTVYDLDATWCQNCTTFTFYLSNCEASVHLIIVV